MVWQGHGREPQVRIQEGSAAGETDAFLRVSFGAARRGEENRSLGNKLPVCIVLYRHIRMDYSAAGIGLLDSETVVFRGLVRISGPTLSCARVCP